MKTEGYRYSEIVTHVSADSSRQLSKSQEEASRAAAMFRTACSVVRLPVLT